MNRVATSGDHVLTQNDVRDGGKFEDIIAYGGWSMDDHHPAGLYFPGEPTIFHPAPSPYGIPFRSLYSRNIGNLLCAGRNISVTHAALSSTRVMATCAVLGQAAGTAAALCIRNRCEPRALSNGDRLHELQQTLMSDDCWLPGLKREVSPLALGAKLCGAGEIEKLRDGFDRDFGAEKHIWRGEFGGAIEYQWPETVNLGGARLVLDSNLNHDKRMPCSYPQKGNRCLMPPTLLRRFRLETRDRSGAWRLAHQETDNCKRLVEIEIGAQTNALRLVPEASWGQNAAHICSFEPLADGWKTKIPLPAPLVRWSEVVARVSPQDLAPAAHSEGEKHVVNAA